MSKRQYRVSRVSPRCRRLQLLVGHTAGAVPGALAGVAVALGAGLSVLAAAALGIVGATLGAVAATADAHAVRRRVVEPAAEPGETPPHGIRVQP